jgi:hypothetical protein
VSCGERRTGVVHVIAGCETCDGPMVAKWTARNAQAVAARHHDATGHTTWAEVGLSSRYGPKQETGPSPTPAVGRR